MNAMTTLDKLMASIAAPFILFALYLLFIWTPVTMYNDADCLNQGYPEGRVSVGLKRYCMSLDGAVTVIVDKQ